jgi:DNA-binding NtrC family response regulator
MNQNLTIYLVEDDEFFASTVRQGLEIKGHKVVHFPNGESLLKQVRTSQPDLVILDYQLDSKIKSAMTGGQIMEILNAKYGNIPVIMLTAQVEIEQAVELIRLGALDYIIKNKHFFYSLVETIDSYFEAIELHSEANKLQQAVSYNRMRFLAIAAAAIGGFLTLGWIYGIL